METRTPIRKFVTFHAMMMVMWSMKTTVEVKRKVDQYQVYFGDKPDSVGLDMETEGKRSILDSF